MKHLFLAAMLHFMLMIGLARGQEYNVQSFDGRLEKIKVFFDFENSNQMTVSCLKDTVHLSDVTGIDKVTILNKKFLKIIYSQRGGSGLHVRRTLILCVNKKKLVESLHITSLFDKEFIDFSKPVDTLNLVDEKNIYELTLNLTGDNGRNYKLSIKIHDEKESKLDPKTDHIYNNNVSLSFDPLRKLFYDKYQKLSGNFAVFNPQTGGEDKQYVMGVYPMVKLGEMEYYYLKGEWYQKSDNEYLVKYSYKM